MRRVLQKPKNVIWTPHPGSQVDFLECPVHEVLLHGSRGGGKTDVLLMDFLQDVGMGHGRDWVGVIFREEYTQLTDIINKSKKWISQIFPGASYNGTDHRWDFPEGETLYLRYMRVPSDYWNYHGHTKESATLVKTPTGITAAKNLRIGDLVQTLEGPKKITKIYNERKYGVKFSVFDSCSNSVFEQYQGVLHPVLTTFGWQRQGLSCLSSAVLQSSTGEHLIAEVQRFLIEIHQEIVVSLYDCLHNKLLDYSTSARHRQLFSSVHQTYFQLCAVTHSESGVGESLPYVRQDSHLVYDCASSGETYAVESPRSIALLRPLLSYCKFLISLLSQIHATRVHLLHSMLFGSPYKYASQGKQIFPLHLQYQYVQQYNPMQLSLLYQLVQDQNAWNDTISYVQHLKKAVSNSQADYRVVCGLNDARFLSYEETDPISFPLRNDVQQSYYHEDDLCISSLYTHDVFSDSSYIHPYTHKQHEIKDPLQSVALLQHKVVPCDTPLDFIDFCVEDANHYLTIAHINNDTSNNHESQVKSVSILDQNSYPFIGWEELTNWATDECYKMMMSTNRSSNPNIPRKIRSTANPSGIGHSWVKHRFIDVAPNKVVYRDPITNNRRVHIVSSLSENTTLLAADPNYQKTILSAVQDDPARYKAWVLGSWDIVDGGFFADLWDTKVHVVNKFPFPKSWDVVRSFDWGSSKPWAVTYMAECNGEQPDSVYGLPYLPKGSAICIMEIYGWNGTANTGDQATSQDIAERVLAVDKAIEMEFGCRVRIGPADTSIWEVRDGTSIAKNMSDHGLWWMKAYKGSGSRVAGWSIIRTMLGAAKRKDLEHPHLYFFDTARHHIRTIPIMQHDKKKPEDLDSELEDHCCDSMRYLLARKLNRLKQRKVRT